MNETDATWYQLLNWQYGPDAAARLATQILLDQGYTHTEPNRPLGGADGRVDALCRKDGKQWAVAVFFLQGEQAFPVVETQFKTELANLKPDVNRAIAGVIFITNQELRFAERQRLEGLAASLGCEIFALERLVAILAQDRMAAVRQQYLSPVLSSGSSTGNNDVAPAAIFGGILGGMMGGPGGALLGGILGAAIGSANSNVSTPKQVLPISGTDDPALLPPIEVHLDEIALRLAAQGQAGAAQARMQALLAASTQGAEGAYVAFRAELLGQLRTITHLPITFALLPDLVRAWQLIGKNARPGNAEQIVQDESSAWFSGATRDSSGRFCLQSLQLQNFRGFQHVYLNLHPRLTVLVAPNGLGKTAILEACRLALWPFVSGFDLSYETDGAIGLDDVHSQKMSPIGQARQFPVTVSATGHIGLAENLAWARSLTIERQGAPTINDLGAQQLQAWATLLQQQTRQPREVAFALPVIVYYGTGRVHGQQTLTARDEAGSDQYTRTFGYRDCLHPVASFQYFAAWFTWICQCRDEARLRNDDAGKWQIMITVVRQVVDDLLRDITGWHTLDYSVAHEKSLVLQHETQGVLRLGQLSDGIRGVLAMVGDLAWRCIKLNPHLGEKAAEYASGVVLIDELDMHLHPSWQQSISVQLQRAFPRLQFIITTHSPQVLSCVPKECIRVITAVTDDEAGPLAPMRLEMETVDYQTQGISSADILAHIMHMDAIPPVEQAKQLSDYRAMIARNQHESTEGLALARLLEDHFGANHPEMRENSRLIGLAAFKRKMAAKKAG
ncbi:MAG: hypothetical protein RL748_2502, partial [Pseudomonadota bacterium]